MNMEQEKPLTRAEEVFRVWMRISLWTYAFGVVFFLALGAYIPAAINYVSARLFTLPLYPLPLTVPEGAFWRALSVSMMAMLTWICGAVCRDQRANANLVPILLVSKFCSTAVFFVLFIMHGHLAYVVGWVTDGPIFLLTAFLWFQALPGANYLARKENDVFVALGNAFLPRGGAFALGYLDLCDAAVADARRMFAAFDWITMVGLRVGLRIVNVAPVLIERRLTTLLSLNDTEREALLMRIETHRWAWVRTLIMVMKVYIVVPFFNQAEAQRAVGYCPESPSQS
jgi:hypothetical protein